MKKKSSGIFSGLLFGKLSATIIKDIERGEIDLEECLRMGLEELKMLIGRGIDVNARGDEQNKTGYFNRVNATYGQVRVFAEGYARGHGIDIDFEEQDSQYDKIISRLDSDEVGSELEQVKVKNFAGSGLKEGKKDDEDLRGVNGRNGHSEKRYSIYETFFGEFEKRLNDLEKLVREIKSRTNRNKKILEYKDVREASGRYQKLEEYFVRTHLSANDSDAVDRLVEYHARFKNLVEGNLGNGNGHSNGNGRNKK